MSLSNPTERELDELFKEYHDALIELSARYRAVNMLERRMRDILGSTWESRYEDYTHEKGWSSTVEWY